MLLGQMENDWQKLIKKPRQGCLSLALVAKQN
jgi:hypothetical protein